MFQNIFKVFKEMQSLHGILMQNCCCGIYSNGYGS